MYRYEKNKHNKSTLPTARDGETEDSVHTSKSKLAEFITVQWYLKYAGHQTSCLAGKRWRVWSEGQQTSDQERGNANVKKGQESIKENQDKDVIIEREPNCTLPQRVSATKEMKRHAPTRGNSL